MDKRNLADRYTDLRIDKGLTQTQLADALSCNKQYISKIEDGSRPLSLSMLERYADFFNVSTDYLLGRNDIPSSDIDISEIGSRTGLSQKSVLELISDNDVHNYITPTINYLLEDYYDSTHHKNSLENVHEPLLLALIHYLIRFKEIEKAPYVLAKNNRLLPKTMLDTKLLKECADLFLADDININEVVDRILLERINDSLKYSKEKYSAVFKKYYKEYLAKPIDLDK